MLVAAFGLFSQNPGVLLHVSVDDDARFQTQCISPLAHAPTPLLVITFMCGVFFDFCTTKVEGPQPYRAGFIVTKTNTESSAQEEVEVRLARRSRTADAFSVAGTNSFY